MTEIVVWLDGGDHQCCGEPRVTGQLVTLALTLGLPGVVIPVREPDRAVVLPDGAMLICGGGVPLYGRAGWLTGVSEGDGELVSVHNSSAVTPIPPLAATSSPPAPAAAWSV